MQNAAGRKLPAAFLLGAESAPGVSRAETSGSIQSLRRADPVSALGRVMFSAVATRLVIPVDARNAQSREHASAFAVS